MRTAFNNFVLNIFGPLKKFLSYLLPAPNFSIYKVSLVNRFKEHGVETSLAYALKNFSHSLVVNKREHLWDFAIAKIKEMGSFNEGDLFLEFGTYKGYSINYFSSRIKSVNFFGFDSFEGLREDWIGWNLPKGSFNLNGQLPKVHNNVSLIKGWFHETVPSFLKSHDGKIKFLHVDCDTYQSAKQIFELVGERLEKGTLIVFDEYIGYSGWQIGEFKAFNEYLLTSGRSYEYLAFTNMQVLVRII
jgi:hypothetical protein